MGEGKGRWLVAGAGCMVPIAEEGCVCVTPPGPGIFQDWNNCSTETGREIG